MPVDVPLPPVEAESIPLDQAAAVALPGGQAPEPVPAEPYGPVSDAVLRTAFDAVQRRMRGNFAEWEGWDWISDFGDPVAEHHAVREAVGVWDESPLRKWWFKGPDGLRAADYCFTNDMAGLEVGQVRYGAFCDERGKMLGDGTVYRGGGAEYGVLVVTALPADGDHFRRVVAEKGLDVEIEEATLQMPHLQVQGPRSRELLVSLCDADVEGLRYFRCFPEPVTIGGVGGCYVSRTGYSGELGYEIYTQPENAARLWQALLDEGASVGIRPYGLAAVESLRIESGLIFIGYDYFPGVTSPFHMNLDRVIRLDAGDFLGREALARELDEGVSQRMVPLVIGGDEAPDYNTPVLQHGRGVGRLLSPSAGRSPTIDRVIGMACIEAELVELGTRLEVTLPDGPTRPTPAAPRACSQTAWGGSAPSLPARARSSSSSPRPPPPGRRSRRRGRAPACPWSGSRGRSRTPPRAPEDARSPRWSASTACAASPSRASFARCAAPRA
jgi:aminomethyltransferase